MELPEEEEYLLKMENTNPTPGLAEDEEYEVLNGLDVLIAEVFHHLGHRLRRAFLVSFLSDTYLGVSIRNLKCVFFVWQL